MGCGDCLPDVHLAPQGGCEHDFAGDVVDEPGALVAPMGAQVGVGAAGVAEGHAEVGAEFLAWSQREPQVGKRSSPARRAANAAKRRVVRKVSLIGTRFSPRFRNSRT